MTPARIINLKPESVAEHNLFCSRNPRAVGFQKKQLWFTDRYKEGLRIKILKDANSKDLGFIEYLPADAAWRPVSAPGYMFIHCVFVYPRKNLNQGNGSLLLQLCEEDADARAMAGVCVITSSGSWMADRQLFEKNGYKAVDQRGRFVLMCKKWDQLSAIPRLLDWEAQQKKYQGWHLVYSDQCPYHDKAAKVIQKTAREYGIEVSLTKLKTAREAKKAPSGFGVFSLLKDGKLLEDHYISETRFRNILKKELA